MKVKVWMGIIFYNVDVTLGVIFIFKHANLKIASLKLCQNNRNHQLWYKNNCLW